MCKCRSVARIGEVQNVIEVNYASPNEPLIFIHQTPTLAVQGWVIGTNRDPNIRFPAAVKYRLELTDIRNRVRPEIGHRTHFQRDAAFRKLRQVLWVM